MQGAEDVQFASGNGGWAIGEEAGPFFFKGFVDVEEGEDACKRGFVSMRRSRELVGRGGYLHGSCEHPGDRDLHGS